MASLVERENEIRRLELQDQIKEIEKETRDNGLEAKKRGFCSRPWRFYATKIWAITEGVVCVFTIVCRGNAVPSVR